MKNMFKVGITCAALAALTPAFANDGLEEENGVIGWTPVALGIATPVQLPYGLERWDVFGLDLNIFYTDTPTMYGLDIAALASVNRGEFMGLEVSGLFNFAAEDAYGARFTLGLNMSRKSVYGLDAGLIAFANSTYGASIHFLGAAQKEFYGLQISGLANVTAQESHGLSIAGITNLAPAQYGLNMSFIFNMTDDLHGAQIALVNYADNCDSGFQIGLVNIIMSNKVKVLPFVNGYF